MLNTQYTVDENKTLYESNFQVRAVVNGEPVCCFPGCSHKPKIDTGKINEWTGEELYKSLCEVHEQVFAVVKPTSWGERKKYYELWDRTPLLVEALGLNVVVWAEKSKEWLYNEFYPKLQELIDDGDIDTAFNTARWLRGEFDCDHILGSKDYGDDYIVPLHKGNHSGKSTFLGDNIKNSNTHTKASQIYSGLTDDVLSKMGLDYNQSDLYEALISVDNRI